MHDPLVKRSILLAGLMSVAMPLAACNTVEGAGKDIESVGDAVGDTAEEVGEEAGEY